MCHSTCVMTDVSRMHVCMIGVPGGGAGGLRFAWRVARRCRQGVCACVCACLPACLVCVYVRVIWLRWVGLMTAGGGGLIGWMDGWMDAWTHGRMDWMGMGGGRCGTPTWWSRPTMTRASSSRSSTSAARSAFFSHASPRTTHHAPVVGSGCGGRSECVVGSERGLTRREVVWVWRAGAPADLATL